MDTEKENKWMLDNIEALVKKLAERAEIEIPETGYFAPVFEDIKNENEATRNLIDRYRLKILKMLPCDEPDSKQRYIEVTAFGVQHYKVDMFIFAGYTEEIITKLRDKDFPEKVYKSFMKLYDYARQDD